MNQNLTVEEYQNAYREVIKKEEKRGFSIHRTIYICVNAALIAINLIFVREFLWFVFPLVGWGIGLMMHYVFGVRKLSENIKAKELTAEKIARGKLDVNS